MKEMKEIKAWAVVNDNGRIVPKQLNDSLAWTTKYQASRYCGGKSAGERVVRVTVRIEE